MASKRRQRRKACQGKTRYESKAEACRILRLYAAPNRMRAYRCSFCGAWHIGHEPERLRRSRTQAIEARRG